MRVPKLRILACTLVLSLPLTKNAASSKPAVAPEVYERLQELDALMAKSAYRDAESKTRQLASQLQDPYAKALVLKTLALALGQQKQYAKAAETMEQALALQTLRDEQAHHAHQALTQFYLAAGNYGRAAQTLEHLRMHHGSSSPEDLLLLANVYVHANRPVEAIRTLEEVLKKAREPQAEPLRLLAALYARQGDYRAAARTYAQLIQRVNPDSKEAWQQLAALHFGAKDYVAALAVKHLMYQQGMLNTEKEILDLVHLYRYNKLPYKGAELLRRELTSGRVSDQSGNWQLLADAWLEAREYAAAAAVLEKNARRTGQGDLWLRAARLHADRGDWSSAQSALNEALKNGGLKDPGSAYVLLGIVRYEQKAKDQAREAFVKAENFPSARKIARQWLDFLTSAS
ncbi:MAG TPA: tetratricopeptide repeat protein [Methylococcus sp.]|nr:tetratricopeptide repeat protein [Methylococcus sp.]